MRTPTHPNDLDGAYVMGMERFSIDNRNEIYIKRKAEEEERKQQEQSTQQLTKLMGIIFGESANLKICNELNERLDTVHDSNTWSDLKKFLDYHSTRCHPPADYPKEKLSTEQRSKFDWLRNDAKTRNKYNVLVEERKQFQEREDEQLEQNREEQNREEQNKQNKLRQEEQNKQNKLRLERYIQET